MLKPLWTPPGKYSIPVVLNRERNSLDSDPCSSRYWTAAPPNALSSSTALYAAALHYDDNNCDGINDDNDNDNNDTLFHLDYFRCLTRNEYSM